MGWKVVKALQRNNDGINHAALDMLCALMQPMHDNPDLKQEQLNKASLLASPTFQEKLLENWVHHVVRNVKLSSNLPLSIILYTLKLCCLHFCLMISMCDFNHSKSNQV